MALQHRLRLPLRSPNHQQQQVPASPTLWLATLALNQLAFGVALAHLSGGQDPHSQSQLIDRCCQVGKTRALDNSGFQCKLSAREALAGSRELELLVLRDPSLAEQCEMTLQSCCVGSHRKRNCDSGKQLARAGSSCMDVELSKEATVATESFNDCCMACSLGVLEARNLASNESQQVRNFGLGRPQQDPRNRCRLPQPLAGSHAGQLYEETFTECCMESLPRRSNGLIEPGAPVDCQHANPCSQRCVSGTAHLDPITRRRVSADRCDCFSGYKLATDGVTCVDLDECATGQHTCASDSQICDNIPGSFRCLIRTQMEPSGAESSPNEQPFSSMRLCPLGSRWSSQENRCTTTSPSSSFSSSSSSTSSSSSSSLLSRSTRRSASLRSLSRLGNQNPNNNHDDDELADLH